MKDVASYWLSLAKDENNSLAAEIVKAFLWLSSLVYGLGVRVFVAVYAKGVLPQKVLPRKVISVGNITLGGSGKTPFVQWLAWFCQQRGFNPAVLTRGYSLKKGVYDEARLLEKNLKDIPIFIGEDRYAAGRQALNKENFDIFLLDDGFQHLKLKRDLDIVMVDSTADCLDGALIPRGFLREPPEALKRADIVVLTKTNLGQDHVEALHRKLKGLCPQADIAESAHWPVALFDSRNFEEKRPLSFLENRTICSFCAIASPESFEKTLSNLGAHIAKNFVFRDHHVYTDNDVAAINRYCRENHITAVVTTQKDAVKLNQYLNGFDASVMVLVLAIEMNITNGKEAIEKRIISLFHG